MESVKPSAETTPGLIHHYLEHSARRFPEKIAVLHGRQNADYSRINGWANRLARFLIDSGVRAGDRVVLLSENSVEYMIGYFGILKAGAVAVPLQTDATPDGWEPLLRELEPRIFVCSRKMEKYARMFDFTRYGISRLLVMGPYGTSSGLERGPGLFTEGVEAQPKGNLDLAIDPQACAAIIYTSGSAGKPKGVMLSHANIVSNTSSIVQSLDLTSGDVQMVVLPFFYVMGMSLLNTHVAVGGRLVINNQFPYTAAVLEQMTETGVTGFSGVPSTYAQLLFRSPLAKYRDRLPALRYCSQAGGHMPKHIKLELLKVLPPQTRLVVMYGATEASARLTYVPPAKLASKIDSIGIPIPGVRIRVLSAAGGELGAGQVGELAASGDNIMLGYFRDEEATRAALVGGEYRTGDLGYSDTDGYFFLTGRKDDRMKVGGHRINPREIEDAIIESGLAAECILIAVSDDQEYDRLVGLAVPIPETKDPARRILDYCRRRLAKHMIPGRLLIVEAIPKNSSGKPDRAKCLDLAARLKAEGSG